MKYVTPAGDAKGTFKLAHWIAVALIAVFAVSFGLSAHAQKAAKESRVTKKAPQVQQLKPEVIDWYKICYDRPDPKKPETKLKECITTYEAYHPLTAIPMAIVSVKSDAKSKVANLMVTVPLGTFIPSGSQLTVDENKPVPMRFVYCAQQGCIAQMPKPSEAPGIVKQFQAGKQLKVVFADVRGAPGGVLVDLKGFSKALKGKAIDQKQYVEKAKKIEGRVKVRQEEFKKRLAEAQKKAQEQKKQ